jgi:hypothetical protein
MGSSSKNDEKQGTREHGNKGRTNDYVRDAAAHRYKADIILERHKFTTA